MTFESRHDAVRLGKLTALDDDGQLLVLASLADLVRYTMGGDSASGLPLDAAAAAVLDKIQLAESMPVIYATRPSTFATAIPADHLTRKGSEATQQHVKFQHPRGHLPGGWQVQPDAGHGMRPVFVPKRSAVNELRGPAGCLEWLREVWTNSPKGEALLSHPKCARYAMRLDLAVLLFGIPTPSSATSPASMANQSESDMQAPEVWGHQAGAAWSDDERVAMFKMRHLEGLTEQAIAQKFRCGRARVAQLIGGKIDWKIPDKYKGKPWQPSAQLLAECGLKSLQPLQIVAMALT